MSKLFLVRHGQARFLSKNYDELSPVGETQARLLGTYWAERKLIFDEVYSGTHVRQRRTAEIVGEMFQRAGLPWPKPALLPQIEEFHGEEVLRKALPNILENNAEIRDLYQRLNDPAEQRDQLRNFQKIFAFVTSRWVRGEIEVAGVESWAAFCERVNTAWNRISRSGGSGRHVAGFTSGGPIAVAMQRALGLSTERTLELAGMILNGAVNEFWFSGDRFTLSAFNSTPHFPDASLLTYR